jgi:phosphinothricin acetyltransferase
MRDAGAAGTLTAGPGQVVLRRAEARDAEPIAAIWNREVLDTDHTTDTEPRSPAAQRAWLRAHGDDHPVIVAARADEVLAYGALSPYRSKPAFRRTVEDSVYVREDQRGRGVGSAVLGRLLDVARARGHHAVLARVTSVNTASLALHERHGFERVGRERETALKHGQWLDVILLEILLPGERST